jgi:uncharacterized RDD family membrane protein YckC
MAGIVTPEAVLLELDVAGLGSRMFSRVLDALFQLILLYGLVLVFVVVSAGSETLMVIVAIVALFLLIFGYPVLMEVRFNGRTFGKMVLGLRVVTVEGGPVRFRHAAVRSMLQLVDFVIPVPGGVTAMISGLLTPRTQRLGDLAAGTFVVRERQAGADAAVVSFPPPPGYEGYVRALDVGTLRPPQYRAIRSFLLRVAQLTPDARARLAHRIAVPLAQQLRHSPPPVVTPELFLVCVASAYQLRQGGFPVARLPGAYIPPPPGRTRLPPPPPSPPGALPPPPAARDSGFRPPS